MKNTFHSKSKTTAKIPKPEKKDRSLSYFERLAKNLKMKS